jgi:hypothetical protein
MTSKWENKRNGNYKNDKSDEQWFGAPAIRGRHIVIHDYPRLAVPSVVTEIVGYSSHMVDRPLLDRTEPEDDWIMLKQAIGSLIWQQAI